jgi:tetratricopeptide (TPR) repeat protein
VIGHEGRKEERFFARFAILAPLALLMLFLGTFRRTAHDAGAPPARDPADAAVLTDLGDSYVSRGLSDLAEDAYRRALAVDPRDGDVHVRLGEVLLQRGDRHGAHVEAESALRWHPGSSRALNLAGRSATAGGAVSEQW